MIVKLGDIYKISSGGTPSKSKREYYENGNINWVKTGDLKHQYLYTTEDNITELGLNNSSAKMYEEDTVLIAMYGATIGATSILKIPACTNQACAAFPKVDSVIPEYLYYFFKSKKSKFIKDGVGGAQPNISAGYLKDINMELKSIDEQGKVVLILNKTSEIIDFRKQQLIDMDNLIKSQFVELFGSPISNPMGWEVKELNEICDVRDGTHDSPSYVEEGYPLVTSKNIVNGQLDLSNVNYITQEDYDNINKRSKVDIGDIIMPMIGTIGNPLIIVEEPSFAIKNVALIKFNKTSISNVYIHTVLSSDLMEQLKIEKSRGGTQKFLSLGDIRKLKIPVPTVELQKQFASFVQQVDKLKLEVQKSLDEMQTLFDSLMQEYFG